MKTLKIDGQLAMCAISRWKSDKTVRSQFKDVSEYYDWLKVKTSSALTITKEERMKNEESKEETLEIRAIREWKNDRTVRLRFGNVARYFEFLKRQKTKEEK